MPGGVSLVTRCRCCPTNLLHDPHQSLLPTAEYRSPLKLAISPVLCQSRQLPSCAITMSSEQRAKGLPVIAFRSAVTIL